MTSLDPSADALRSPRPESRAFGLTDYLLYAITVFAWSTSWIAIRNQLGSVAPEVSVAWRFVVAAAVMWGVVAVAGIGWRFPLRTHLRFMGLGALLFSTNFTLFYYGGQHIASGLMSVVFSLASIVNLAVGAVMQGGPVDRRTLAGGVAGFCGVALMFWPEIAGAGLGREAGLGFLFCTAGTLVFCTGNLVSAATQRAGVPVLAANAWGMVYGAAFLAGFAALRGQSFTVEPTFAYLGSLAWLAVVSSVVAFWAYLTLLGRIGAGRAGYATVVFPVAALAISTVFEGYVWTAPAFAGLVLVLAGNLFVLTAGRTP